jgi:hypothetical protein
LKETKSLTSLICNFCKRKGYTESYCRRKGEPGMQEQYLAVHTRDRTWYYYIQAKEIYIVDADEFEKLAQECPQVVVLLYYIQPSTICRMRTVYKLHRQSESQIVLTGLPDFEDVFQVPEEPISVQGVEHRIETSSNTPFRPIYSLSGRELGILRIYLDTVMKKK